MSFAPAERLGSVGKLLCSEVISPVPFGAVAQLAERFHGMEEVRGSIPLSSTVEDLLRPIVQGFSRGTCRWSGSNCGAIETAPDKLAPDLGRLVLDGS